MSDKHRHRQSLSQRIARQLELARHATIRIGHRTMGVISSLSTILMILSAVASAVCLVCLIVRAGFDHTPADIRTLHSALRAIQAIFLTNIIFNLVLNLLSTLRNTRTIKWIVDIAMLLTLLPLLYPHPEHPWIPMLERLLYSSMFLYVILASYSVVTLSYALFKIVGRRTNPSLLLSGSFMVFILIGSFMLMLPKCTYSDISYIDALFVSTSAVSITGLTPVDVSSAFTPLGTFVIAVLIQIGAIGVLTFTSFFALFFSGNTTIYSQLLLKDMVYSKNMSALVPTLLYTIAFTIAIEAAGAVLIFFSIHGSLGMDTAGEIAFASFHSLSSFCNAGFSTLPDGMANPMLLGNNLSIYWITSLLVIAGSIGFPILVNIREAATAKLRSIRQRLHGSDPLKMDRRPHLYNMNTKIVLVTSLLIFIAGSLLFFILEYDNSLAAMSLDEKITQSVFNATTPRSSGFISVNPAGFLGPTLIVVMFQMWIGGASQSTAGGIKVNTFAAICLNIRAIVTGNPRVTAFRRNVSVGSIRRANAVVALSIISYLIVSFTIMLLEPDLPPRALLFESLSALFTVGSSLGITDQLSTASKILLSVAMFVGRVGIISLLAGLVHHHSHPAVTYPTDNIIIN